MAEDEVPAEIRDLADARALARAGKDWPEADRLRGEIEAAGWSVVDGGFSYRLERAHPPTVGAGPETRYGRSVDVPSRLEEPATGVATVILTATAWPADVERAIASLQRTSPEGTGIVVVADDPTPEQADALDGRSADVELIRTSAPLGAGASLQIGIRRAVAPVVIVIDASIEALGDVVSPVVAALADPTVGVAGPFGIVTDDLRRFRDAPSGDVAAIEGYLQAFRRSDAAERGPIDERFRFYRNLDIWWSLVLRDEGEGLPARRAVAVPEMPLVRHEHRGWTSVPPEERDRLSKRNFYRIIDRFGSRRDLIVGG